MNISLPPPRVDLAAANWHTPPKLVPEKVKKLQISVGRRF